MKYSLQCSVFTIGGLLPGLPVNSCKANATDSFLSDYLIIPERDFATQLATS